MRMRRLFLLGDGEVCDLVSELAGWLSYDEVSRGDDPPAVVGVEDHVVVHARDPARARSLIARVLAVGDPAYLGLVATEKEALVTLLKLASERVEKARLDRVSAPAGHSLAGVATSPKETAIAVAAELLAARRSSTHS